jgi:hypothetical protein
MKFQLITDLLNQDSNNMPTSAGPNSKGEKSLVFAFDMADTQNSNLGLPVHNVIRPLNEWYLNSRIQIEELPAGSYNSPIRNARIWKCGYDINNASSTNPLSRDGGEGYSSRGNPLILPDTLWRGESLYYYSMWVRGFNTNASDASVEIDLNDRSLASASVSDEVWRKLEVYNTRAHELTHFDFHDIFPKMGSKDSIDFLVTGLMLCRTEGNEYAELGSITTPPAWLPEGVIRSNAAINPVDKTPLSLNVSYTSDKTFEFDGSDDYIQIPYNSTTEVITVEQVLKSPMTSRTCSFGLIENITGTSYVCFDWWIDPGDTMRVYTYDGSGYCDQGVRNSSIVSQHANKYFHLVVSKQESLLKVFVNGKLIHSDSTWTNGGPPLPLTAEFARIGTRSASGNTSQSWQGEIPITKVYNKALSAEEVSANFEVIRKRFNI